jgi:hypothetical protein
VYTAAGVAIAVRGGANRPLGALVDAAMTGSERDVTDDSSVDERRETPRGSGPAIYDAPEQPSGSALH